MTQSGRNQINRARYLRQGASDGRGNSSVFRVDESSNLDRRFAVEFIGGAVGLLAAKAAQIGLPPADLGLTG